MVAPRTIVSHTLEGLKGWPSLHALDFAAPLSANVTIDPLYAGRVVHLNTSEEFETGLPNTNLACNMPIFLIPNSDDNDVSNPGGDPESDYGAWVASDPPPSAKLVGLVATGAYELQTTEFEPEADAGVYNPGQGLTATNANTTAATGGRITKGTAYAVPLCGVVSRKVITNAHGVKALSFWPVWLPRHD